MIYALPRAGNGYVLGAAATGMTSDTSDSFNILPSTEVKSAVLYDDSASTYYLTCWLQGHQDVVDVGASDTCAATIYKPDGSAEATVTTGNFSTPDADDIFSYSGWTPSDTSDIYYAVVTVNYDDGVSAVDYVSNVVYDIRNLSGGGGSGDAGTIPKVAVIYDESGNSWAVRAWIETSGDAVELTGSDSATLSILQWLWLGRHLGLRRQQL